MLRSNHLHAPSRPWIGPRAWVEALTEARGESRWVTIVGAIGSGKTRLAQEAGAEAGPPRGVHVQLDHDETSASLEAKLAALPAKGHPLLVVDSAERAPDAVRSLIPRWLSQNDARRVLVTSRIQLGPSCGRTWWMPPLGLDDAVALFEQSVRDTGATFDVEAHRGLLAQAIRDLGGAPLAILGLAQRALVVGPRELLESVSQAPGRLGLPARDGTLRDAAREAWASLPPHARPQLSSLAVFAEPAPPQDIATVCELDAADLEGLFARSAIRSRTVAEQKQLEVIPLLRDFARETAPDLASVHRHRSLFLERAREHPEHPPWQELAAAAESASMPEDALALWVAAAPALAYGGSARRALAALQRLWPEQPTATHRLALGNLARICGEAARGLAELTTGHDEATGPELKAELACALATAWRHSGEVDKARSAYERIISSEESPDTTRARASEGLGGLELEQGSLKMAEQHLLFAEEMFDRHCDLAGAARVRHVRGLIAQERGDFDAAEHAFTLALRDHQASGANRFAAIAVFDLGALHLERGRLGAARRALRQALHALQHAGDRRQIGLTHALLGVCASEDGHVAEAWTELRKARASTDNGDVQAIETIQIYSALVAGSALPIPTTSSDESRYAQRLVGAIQRRVRTRVSIREDGSAVEHPTRGHADIRSDAARNILAALVRAFESGSSSTVHRDALIRVGWPERRSIDSASRNRLNVELSRLRKAGLHDQIERIEDGYRLAGPLLIEPGLSAK